MKGTRRYRYYVSRHLIRARADQAHRGWLLSASEIERIVAVAARQMLDDEKAILDAVQSAEIASHQIPEIMHSASAWSHRLKSATECSLALAVLADRVELSPDGGFRLALKLPVEVAPTAEAATRASIAVSRFVPMQIERRGVELRLIVNGDRDKAWKADPAPKLSLGRIAGSTIWWRTGWPQWPRSESARAPQKLCELANPARLSRTGNRRGDHPG